LFSVLSGGYTCALLALDRLEETQMVGASSAKNLSSGDGSSGDEFHFNVVLVYPVTKYGFRRGETFNLLLTCY